MPPSEMPIEVIAITSDDENGLWGLTASHGVFRIDRDFRQGDRTSVQWFGVTLGLPSNAGRGWSKGIMKTRDGRIWACTAKGIGMLDPRQWRAERDRIGPPQVHIEEVLLDDVPVDRQADGRLVVPPGVSRLEIRFTALGLSSASENRFRHQLTGVDRTMRDSGTRRSAVYHNLPLGEHRFHVIAANSLGVWNETGATMRITVLPAWWQRRLVWMFCGVLLVTGAALFYHGRLRREEHRRALQEDFSRRLIRSQEEERRRIAGELHDGLGQNLLVAKNLALLGLIKPLSSEESPARFQEISDSIGNVINEMRTISRALRPPELDNLGLTKAIHAALHRLASTSEIRVKAEISEIDSRLSPEDEINFYRLIQEALANVMKHSQARELQCRVSVDEAGIHASIQDDGRGFDLARVGELGRTGLGLLGMQERVHLMGGHFRIETMPGKGTRLTMAIPTKGDAT